MGAATATAVAAIDQEGTTTQEWSSSRTPLAGTITAMASSAHLDALSMVLAAHRLSALLTVASPQRSSSSSSSFASSVSSAALDAHSAAQQVKRVTTTIT